MPRVKRNRDKVEGQKLKMQEILDTLNVQSSPPDETPSLGKRVPHLTPADSHNVAGTSIPESGAPLALFRRSVQRLIAPALSTPTFQPADGWSDVHSLCTSSPL